MPDEPARTTDVAALALDYSDRLIVGTVRDLHSAVSSRVFKATREAGPDVVVNSRVVTGLGDYLSTADRPAEFYPVDGDWEAIPTTNESYGYHKADRSHKPPGHFITLIAKAAALSARKRNS